MPLARAHRVEPLEGQGGAGDREDEDVARRPEPLLHGPGGAELGLRRG